MNILLKMKGLEFSEKNIQLEYSFAFLKKDERAHSCLIVCRKMINNCFTVNYNVISRIVFFLFHKTYIYFK